MCNLRNASYDVPGVSLPKIQPIIAASSFMLLSAELDNQLKEKPDEKGLVYVYSKLSKYTAELASQEQTCKFQLESIPKTLKLKE